MRPKVTVILSTFNNVDTIDSAIKSVLSQTFTNFELVIVCDGSKDGTCEIIDKYGALERVSILDLESNIGKPLAFNLGVFQSTGEWIAIMDGDDIWLPDKLMQQVLYLDLHTELDVLGTNVTRFGTWGQAAKPTRVKLDNSSIHRQFKKAKMGFNNPSVIFRRSSFYAIGGYRGHMRRNEDFDLFYRMSNSGMNFGNIEDSLVLYRTSTNVQFLSYWIKVEIGKMRVLRENRFLWYFRFSFTATFAYFYYFSRMFFYYFHASFSTLGSRSK